MSSPYFFVKDLTPKTIVLDEPTSKHIVQVLRMQRDEQVLLTDGAGTKATALISDDNRKRCAVTIQKAELDEQQPNKVSIAISLLKNASRFEWFLEKATEMGVRQIIPLVCERTESEKFRHDRLNGILISAMLQSQQCWLPLLHQPTPFKEIVKEEAVCKWVAHCLPGEKTSLLTAWKQQNGKAGDNLTSQLILIGPEGDFTDKEVMAALKNNFHPVGLGNTRLRTETAGLVAATLLCQLGAATLEREIKTG
ncbi:MAG TPA: RsmE family RNA methyltransferase [Flavisolibacter sp.]